MRRNSRPFMVASVPVACIAVMGLAVTWLGAQAPADTQAPVLQQATIAGRPDGNGGWFRSMPVAVTLAATDNVGVTRLQYSLDGGAMYLDAAIAPGPSVRANVTITQQGNTALRYRAIDAAGNVSAGDPAPVVVPPPAGGGRGAGGRGGGGGGGGRGGAAAQASLAAPASPGATGIRVGDPAGRGPGETMALGTGTAQETITIDRVVADAPGAEPNVFLRAPLRHQHAAGDTLLLAYRTIAVQIDSHPPVASWPSIIDDRILQSKTLAPVLSDPRRQTPADTAANGAGATAIRRMEVDGAQVFPFPLTLNAFTVGEHSQTVALQDAAGNAINHTRKFLVTTSFEDLTAVLTQYETNALRTTLAAAAVAGDTGVRLATPYGFRPGQTLVIGTGSEQETTTIASVPSPPPQQGANVVLAAPLSRAHATGDATPVLNPRPLISPSAADSLRAIVVQAGQRAGDGQAAQAVDALRQFTAAVAQAVPADRAAHRAALTSASQALIDQLQGRPRPVVVNAATSSPGTPFLRVFTDPTPPVRNANATYRVLVNGNTNGFRHEHVTDSEALIQKLGAANGFDVDIWDRGTGTGPGRQTPAGVSLATSPFLDLGTLKQYRTLVFVSTVGRDPGGSLNAMEFANLQAYIRGGGGLVAIHGATDAYQNNPWYVELVGGGFSGHGGNVAGIMPDCPSCGEVELVTDDATHPATQHLRARFPIHDELYNTSRNPVALGLVHPLVMMNEATVVGQINYNVGPLMNSDRHGMVWCRNFEGGRTFTTVIGHSWHLTHEPWYQQMLLKGIQTTAGVVPANCVTYAEVSELVAAGAASGGVSAAAASAMNAALAAARLEYERGNYQATMPHLNAFLAQAQQGIPAGDRLRAKGTELIGWMKGLR